MKVPLKSRNAFMLKIVLTHYDAEMVDFHLNAHGNRPGSLIVAYHL